MEVVITKLIRDYIRNGVADSAEILKFRVYISIHYVLILKANEARKGSYQHVGVGVVEVDTGFFTSFNLVNLRLV